MSNLKPDITSYTSQLEAYGNYATLTGNIIVSGSVLNGNTAVFDVTIPYTRSNTRADVYLKNASTGKKVLFNNGVRMSTFENVYQFVSSEVCYRSVAYTSTTIVVGINIVNNTGGTIVLTNQTLEVSVVLYDAPF